MIYSIINDDFEFCSADGAASTLKSAKTFDRLGPAIAYWQDWAKGWPKLIRWTDQRPKDFLWSRKESELFDITATKRALKSAHTREINRQADIAEYCISGCSNKNGRWRLQNNLDAVSRHWPHVLTEVEANLDNKSELRRIGQQVAREIRNTPYPEYEETIIYCVAELHKKALEHMCS